MCLYLIDLLLINYRVQALVSQFRLSDSGQGNGPGSRSDRGGTSGQVVPRETSEDGVSPIWVSVSQQPPSPLKIKVSGRFLSRTAIFRRLLILMISALILTCLTFKSCGRENKTLSRESLSPSWSPPPPSQLQQA